VNTKQLKLSKIFNNKNIKDYSVTA